MYFSFSQQVRRLGAQCVTQQGSSQTCCSVRVVANITMRPVWRSVPRPSSGPDGSARSVKCARLAGASSLENQTVLYASCSDVVIHHFHGIDIVLENMCWIVLEVNLFSPLNIHRQPGEDSKMLVCDACDKGYHTFCLQPAMDSLPSDPWKCRVGHIYFHLCIGLSCPNCVCKPVHMCSETDISPQKCLSLSGRFEKAFSNVVL